MQIESPDTTLEAGLLKTLSIKANYDEYFHLIDVKRLLTNTALLLKDYEKYYQLNPTHSKIDWGLFYTQFAQDWHLKDLTITDIEYYKDYVFPAIRDSRIENTENCILGLLKQVTLNNLCLATETLNPEKIRTILDEFDTKSNLLIRQEVDPDAITSDIVNLEILDKSKGIPYFLAALQNNLGGLIQGQFVVIAADKNTGKSAFCISQAVETFKWLLTHPDKGPILIFNSEGTPADVYGRFWSNFYKDIHPEGMEYIVKHREKIRQEFNEENDYKKFIVFQLETNKIDFIETKIKKYSPSLVIIDMLDSAAEEEDHLTLKKLYDNTRRISLTSCPIIATTQSGNTRYFNKETGQESIKRWLTEEDVLNCKAKVAAAETFITIGREIENKNLRFINTPKVKRGEEVRFTCLIENKYSLYKEIAW